MNKEREVLNECLKIINKPNKTREKVIDYLRKNPLATWKEVVDNVGLCSNGSLGFHIQRARLIIEIEKLINSNKE